MKVSVKYWRSSLAVVMVVMALIMSTPAVFADNINPGVLPINGQIGGLTYGQWSEKWWQYAFSVTTFAHCPAEPSGQMWFLAGATNRRGIAVRNCIVPSGKNIMFPVFNAEWSVAEAREQQETTPKQSCFIPDLPNGTSAADLLACATAQANQALDEDASLEADVDGVTLQNLPNFRAVSPPFTFTTVARNPFGLCPADGSCPLTSRAVADGFWIILTPLSPGMHTVHFAASVPFPKVNPPATPFTFTTDATYHLMVQPER